MAVIQETVTIDGVPYIRHISDQHVKIYCKEDGNVYQVAYVRNGCDRTFGETDIQIEDYKIQASDIIGLSVDVLNTISANNEWVADVLDGTKDDTASINAGGASD